MSFYSTTNGLDLNFSVPKRVCPVCGPHSDGALTVMSKDESLAGDYCLLCYARWINANIPRLLLPTGEDGR